jgi:hypothetical protein
MNQDESGTAVGMFPDELNAMDQSDFREMK